MRVLFAPLVNRRQASRTADKPKGGFRTRSDFFFSPMEREIIRPWHRNYGRKQHPFRSGSDMHLCFSPGFAKRRSRIFRLECFKHIFAPAARHWTHASSHPYPVWAHGFLCLGSKKTPVSADSSQPQGTNRDHDMGESGAGIVVLTPFYTARCTSQRCIKMLSE